MNSYLNPQVAVPQLKNNGTSPAELFETNRAAKKAVAAALEAVRATGPHGRDYLGQPEQFHRARSQWGARLSALNLIIDELDLIAFGIKEQQER